MRVAISPRLAMNSVRIGVSAAALGRRGRCPGHQRVNRVTCDTPTSPNASRRQSTASDPALDGPRRRADARCSLARAQFLGHRCRDRRISRAMAWAARSSAAGATYGSGVQAGLRFSVNAVKPSCASSLVRCRAMTRAVCHFADPWPSPRTSRTIALAARAAVGPAARGEQVGRGGRRGRSATAARRPTPRRPRRSRGRARSGPPGSHRTGDRRGRAPAHDSRRSWRSRTG